MSNPDKFGTYRRAQEVLSHFPDAWLTACAANKAPMYRWKTLRPTEAQLRGAPLLGIRPSSISCAVVDIDKGGDDLRGVALGLSSELGAFGWLAESRRVDDHLGNPHRGGYHLWLHVLDPGPDGTWSASGGSGELRCASGQIIIWDDQFIADLEHFKLRPACSYDFLCRVLNAKVSDTTPTADDVLARTKAPPMNRRRHTPSDARFFQRIRNYTRVCAGLITQAAEGGRHALIVQKSRTVGGYCAGYKAPPNLEDWCRSMLVHAARACGSAAGARTARELFDLGYAAPLRFEDE